MVYGDFEYDPADEKHPTRPREIYGTMKLAGEIATRGLAQYFGIPATIVRPSAVYGPTDMNRRVTQIFLENAILGRKLVVHGEDEKLDFTFVADAAKGFVLAATKTEGAEQTFNITSGHAHTLVQYAEALKEHFPDLRVEIAARDTGRPKRGTLDIGKARDLLGYTPDHSLASGVEQYVRFVRQHGGMGD